MKKIIIIISILILVIGLAYFQNWKSKEERISLDRQFEDYYSNPIHLNITDCEIEEPDPDGYLLKICHYLKEHQDTILFAPMADPTKFKIKSVEESEYTMRVGDEEIVKEAFKVRLDCCYMGDIATIDKVTKEVVAYSPGDM